MDIQNISNWDDMRFLLALSRNGSTLKTANALNVSHQTVSRRLQALEISMNTKLIDRSITPWQLTLMGEKLLVQAEQIEKCMRRAAQISRTDHKDMSGRVSITSADLGLEFIILPYLEKALSKYPKLQFDIKSSTLPENLSSGEFDLALRFTKLPPPDLIGRKIGTIEFAFYGAPKLIKTFDQSIEKNETITIPIINLLPPHEQTRNLSKKYISQDTPIHNVSDLPTLISTVKLGLGVGLLPKIIAKRETKLKESNFLQPDKNLDIWLLRNQDSRNSLKLKKIEAHFTQYASKILDAIA